MAIKDNYDNGECPDCGEPIPEDMVKGGDCLNCRHVFQDDDEIQDSVNDLISVIKSKVAETSEVVVYNELRYALQKFGNCDPKVQTAPRNSTQTASSLLRLAGFNDGIMWSTDEADESTVIGVYTTQGNKPPYLVATVIHPANKNSFELGKGALKLIEDAWDEFLKGEPELDKQFETYLVFRYGFKAASFDAKPDISITV
jgi:hypothetical protein|tara:strand:+ start:5062 stop:5661 length:600 start_codon:yes stop_codon:yes gene_type:complete